MASMKIASVRIENFRSFKDETVVLNDYNCLIGANGSGKSTILNALNIFFRDPTSTSVADVLHLTEEDFHCKNTKLPIRITVTFADLSEVAKIALKDYARQDKLVVSAVAEWSPLTRIASVVQKGSRLGMSEFAPYFRALADGQLAEELKAIYADIRATKSSLPSVKTKQAMADALRSYEQSHPSECGLIESEDEFYGATKGAHKLGPFVQWVFVPAVKDASTEQQEAKNTAFGRLVERVVRSKVQFSGQIKALRESTSTQYDTILKENQESLDDLSKSLRQRLSKWAHPDVELSVKWDRDPSRSVRVEEPYAKILAGDCGFLGEISRLGHGLQRSYIIALLEELSAFDSPNAPRLLLGLEEPELFQHPPQAQHLAEVLQQLSAVNAQIAVCSHSPYFVVGKGFEDVALVRKDRGSSEAKVSRTTFTAVSDHLVGKVGEPRFKQPVGVKAKLHQALRPALSEMFFCPSLVLVEGQEDIAFVTSGLLLANLWEDWRKCGAHIVAVNGKSEFVYPLALAQLLNIPVFTMFDADGDIENANRRLQHQRDNERVLMLLDTAKDPAFPAATIWEKQFVIWPQNIAASISSDYQRGDWDRWKAEAEHELGHAGGLGKNSIFVSAMMAKAWDEGKPSATLTRLCQTLLHFANTTTA
jgi:putative ATP-dependent endonuclease of the OLD family